jgi:uncharacterized protein YdeI (YjbR/CyaY-like superfamily)
MSAKNKKQPRSQPDPKRPAQSGLKSRHTVTEEAASSRRSNQQDGRSTKRLPESVEMSSDQAWRDWLSQNHTRSTGIWLITHKASADVSRLTYDEAVSAALCFGWIDSKPRKVDDQRSALWFAPRKPRSGWSRVNKQRIARMQAAGLMHAAGQAKIDAAVADGSWTKLDAVDDLIIPDDLQRALKALPPASEHFAAFPPSIRRGILEWIIQAKRPETRHKRVTQTAELAAVNQRANQWRPKS